MKSHICPHSCNNITNGLLTSPHLTSQLATGLLSSPEQSHFYIFVSNMKTETLTRQDVNQWQGDRDLEQEPDADITPDSVIMQCVARQVSRQETGQTVTQWYTGPQGWCWEIRSWGRCHPDGGWRVASSPSHLTFILQHTCRHQTSQHYTHNTVFRFSINLVTPKSVTCSLVWSWGGSLSGCFEVDK